MVYGLEQERDAAPREVGLVGLPFAGHDVLNVSGILPMEAVDAQRRHVGDQGNVHGAAQSVAVSAVVDRITVGFQATAELGRIR